MFHHQSHPITIIIALTITYLTFYLLFYDVQAFKLLDVPQLSSFIRNKLKGFVRRKLVRRYVEAKMDGDTTTVPYSLPPLSTITSHH